MVVVHATNVSGRSAPVLRPQGNAGLSRSRVQPVGTYVSLSYVFRLRERQALPSGRGGFRAAYTGSSMRTEFPPFDAGIPAIGA